MTDPRPHAPATSRNRDPILDVLRRHFADRRSVLEIGSGTGQHAVHFAAALPQLTWQCSDRAPNLPGIETWLDHVGLPNTPAPVALDVLADAWPGTRFDAAFSANTLHIMGWDAVRALFDGLDRALEADAVLAVYGPFKRNGAHTSDSNAAFDAMLRGQAPHQGVRDLEAVHGLAAAIGLRPVADVALPANNACLVWRRA
ncbi:DUF938 domain-containing protein [Coralloluteibacterium stylophorae]|uniref:DUF938 domain-containing protein n=1 Tax=Coralloluteibacterium stylophorae TaxID=1776034 RepID=A0A8J7VWQ1_9GAMM|nr:DUF938 domain-containing protein [Coralloluteibacterium stylophorae]MBS7459025.1 DUF938 domain-containing protein [Coralloluteibacterium stylophorae]